jgi:peptidyl-dipeptidase Dcp
VARVVALRQERAALLGYPNFAAYVLEDQTAKTPATVNKLLRQLARRGGLGPREAADLQQLIDAEQAAKQPSFGCSPGTGLLRRQGARGQVRLRREPAQALLEISSVLEQRRVLRRRPALRPELQARTDLPVYHDDVRVYDVFDADGKPAGHLHRRPVRPPNKRGGAWMNAYVSQSR